MAYEDFVVKPKENFRGMSYGDWAAAWSNWLFSEDADRNEAEGPVLFLRGNIEHYLHSSDKKSTAYDNGLDYNQDDTSFYNRTSDRCVVIPRDKAILIPVLTSMQFIGGQYGGRTSNSEDQIRSAAQTENDKSRSIWALIQRLGEPTWEPIVHELKAYRVTSSVFTIRISDRSAFLHLVREDHIEAGEYEAVTDGFFILMNKLPEEAIRLQFGGRGRRKYLTNAIYDIHVTDYGRSQELVMDVTTDIINNIPNPLIPLKVIKKDTDEDFPSLAKIPEPRQKSSPRK